MQEGEQDRASGTEALLAAMPWLGLDAQDLALYRTLLAGAAPDDVAAIAASTGLDGERVGAGLARLAECGFVSGGRVTPPGSALRALVHQRTAEAELQQAELERTTARIEDLVAEFVGRVPEAMTGSGGSVELITGAENVGLYASDLIGSARSELLVFNAPPYAQLSTPAYADLANGPAVDDPPSATEDVTGQALVRGVRVRHVIAQEGIDVPRRMSELVELTHLGLEVRVRPRVPTKLIVADGSTALLPPTGVADPTSSALILRDGLLTNVLVPLFDAIWDTSLPLGMAAGAGRGPSEEERALLGLLSSGLKDEAIARQLDVHVHTARRRITSLLAHLGAETRFQAGIQAIRRGWLG